MPGKALSFACLVIIIGSVLACTSCGGKSGLNATIDFITGTVTVLRENLSEEPAEVRKQLFKGDRVRTAADSHAFVQFGDTNLIHMSGNTECEISSIADIISAGASGTDVLLEKGSVGVIAGKLLKGNNFRVITPTIVVAVRGTIFRVIQKGGTSRVIVNEGKVAIKSLTGIFSEIILTPGKEAIISGSSVSTRNNKSDDEYFRNLRGLGPVKNIQAVDDQKLANIFLAVTGKTAHNRASADMEKKGPAEKPGKTGSDDVKDVEPPASAVKARMAVTMLAANGVDASEAAGISEKLYSALAAMKGGTSVVFRKKFDKRSANRILTGRVSRLGKSTIISVSVVDGENGTVMFNKTVTVKVDQKVEDSIKGIAGQIAGQNSLWE